MPSLEPSLYGLGSGVDIVPPSIFAEPVFRDHVFLGRKIF